ncbi:MAG: EAL domain-containing protein [Psychrobium sp.]|nr:EAL domain-containing protein [Psychrobium sp.]
MSLTQAVSAIEKVFLATKSIIKMNPGLSASDFSQLINKEFLLNTGMQGMQWAPLITQDKLPSFEQQVRDSGIFDYRVHNFNKQAVNCFTNNTKNYFPVLFSQPLDMIGHELGLQLSSDCEIANSMQHAIDTGQISSSRFKSASGELGLRLIQPIYQENGELFGFIAGVVMINTLVDSLWNNINGSDNYQLDIYHNQHQKEQLYHSQWRGDCTSSCDNKLFYLKLETSIPFANQLWYIEYSQRAVSSRDLVLAYVGTGLIILLVFGLSAYLMMSLNRINWANTLVEERTRSLKYQASHDKLTSLYNKQALTDALTFKTSDRDKRRFSVLFIDLDHFKKINDTMGHLVGDKLLQQVAKRLRQSARDNDDIFRFGGDEFVIILNDNYQKEQVASISQRILTQLIEAYVIDGGVYRIGASIGVLTIDDLDTTCDEIIRNADIAMYEAKNKGRGQVVFYQSQMYQQILNTQSIETSLINAVSNKQMRLHLQPIFSAQRQLIGFEALSRWQHPDKGLIMPDEFITIAEESGVIHQLGAWVIDTVCLKLAQWIKQYGVESCPYVSINVSPYQLAKPNVVAQVKAALQRYNIPAHLLAVELTESALIENKIIVKQHLMELRKCGVRIFLDDFGTGYSSLSLLQDFPIDVLKIDRSFVMGISNGNLESKNLVRAIISMATALNMNTIAEGVEDNETLHWLSKINCQSMQGYYFSRPLNTADLEVFLAKHVALSSIDLT